MRDQLAVIASMSEVRLPHPDDFLIVRETLTRIGLVEADGKTLCQLCHILHKQGRYFITHFKELFALDGQASDLNDTDLARRNTIVVLLAHWNLIEPLDKDYENRDCAPISDIKVVPFQQKADWTLTAKYQLGKHKQQQRAR